MFFRLSVAISLLAICRVTVAQVPFPNQCPDVKIVEEFDLDAYMGVWYEYSKYPFVFEIGKKCMYARYENIGNNTISVMNAAISRLTGNPSNVTGTAKALGPGQLAVSFSRNQNTDKANYLVLGTDYTSFVLVYSCTNFTPIAHTKIIWILTRERQPKQEAVKAARKVMEDNNLSQAFLIDTLQDDCPKIDDTAAGDDDLVTVVTPSTTANTETEVASESLTTTTTAEPSNAIDRA